MLITSIAAQALAWRPIIRFGELPEWITEMGMGLLLLEALLALGILVGIVWWTMFAGRKSPSRKPTESDDPPA